MINIIYLALVLTLASWQVLGEECVQDYSFFQEITKDIDDDDLADTEVSIEQLLTAKQLTNKQITCLKKSLNDLSERLENTNVTQKDNRSLIDENSRKAASTESSIDENSRKAASIESFIDIINNDIAKLIDKSKTLNGLIKSNKASVGRELTSLSENLNVSTKGLTNDIAMLRQSLDDKTSELSEEIRRLKLLNSDTNSDVIELSADASGNILRLDDYILYLVIAIIITLLLLIVSFVVSRVFTVKKSESILENLNIFKQDVELNTVNADNKLAEILELFSNNVSSNKASDEDHSLALKVADEIVRIEKNTSKMDAKTKGLKQLVASVKRIQDNFAANGYEIVNMLNQPYDERMKVSASFVPSEELETDEQIITKIIKPQVNYQGSMIQAAQIEVSVGE